MGSAKLTNTLLIIVAVLLVAILIKPQSSAPTAFDILPEARKSLLRPDVAARLKLLPVVSVEGTVDVAGTVQVDGDVQVIGSVEVDGPVAVHGKVSIDR